MYLHYTKTEFEPLPEFANLSEEQVENSEETEEIEGSDTIQEAKEDNITEAEVSYTAQKVFFERPTQEVTGTTSEVEGWVDYQHNFLSGSADISTDNLATGNNTRDNDVRDLIGAEIIASIPVVEVMAGEIND